MVLEPTELPTIKFGASMGQMTQAFRYPFKDKRLLLYTFLAFLINGILVSILIGLLVWGISSLLAGLEPWLEAQTMIQAQSWWESIYVFLMGIVQFVYGMLKWVILVLLLIFVVPPLYPLLLNLNPITSLFAYKIFQVVFELEVGQPLPGKDQGGEISPMQSIGTEIRKLIGYLGWVVLTLLISFLIPVVGTILSVVLLYIINAQYQGWAFITIYYEALGYTFKAQKQAVRKQRVSILGLGTMGQLLLLVPVVNIFVLFIQSIAGALLAAQIEKKRLDTTH